MSGARKGCRAIIQHCAAHRLNLAVVSSCKNVESYVGEIARFFKYSPKRQALLDKSLIL